MDFFRKSPDKAFTLNDVRRKNDMHPNSVKRLVQMLLQEMFLEKKQITKGKIGFQYKKPL